MEQAESFRERNRRRREQNAFVNLYAYAQSTSLPDAQETAERAARQIHGTEAVAGRTGRLRRAARAATERAARASTSNRPSAAAGVDEAAPKRSAGGAAAGAKAAANSPAAEAAPRSGSAEPGAVAEPQSGDAEASSVPHRLEDRSKDQLYARAQELEIEGRSQMTKDQLIDAIRSKQ